MLAAAPSAAADPTPEPPSFGSSGSSIDDPLIDDAPFTSDVEGATDSCSEIALSRKLPEWSCMGSRLTTPQGTEKLNVEPRAPLPTPQPEIQPRDLPDPDDYDNWCETGTVCSRTPSAYVSETKANIAFGDDEGVQGTWDLIIRNNLNGRAGRWTVTYIWDSGLSNYFIRTDLNCFEVVPGPYPDSRCGIHYAGAPLTISPTNRTASYGPIYGTRLEDAGTYYAAMNGQNHPIGVDYVVTIPTLETKRFVCPVDDGWCYFPNPD